MKPAAFEYHSPTTVDEAAALLEELPETVVLAGGQSLVPLMNLRLSQPEHLLDLGRIEGLRDLSVREGRVEAAALVTQRRVEGDPEVKEAFPLMVEAIRRIGFPAIRTRGTLGGSLAHADPAAELPLIAVTVGAEINLLSRSKTRIVGADDFFVGHYTTVREPTELIVGSSWPSDWDTWGFSEFARRTGDFAIVAAAIVANLNGDVVTHARLAVSGIAGTPVRLTEAEEILRGNRLTQTMIKALSRAVAGSVDPIGDIHASPEFRRRLVGVQVGRALLDAAERAKRGGD